MRKIKPVIRSLNEIPGEEITEKIEALSAFLDRGGRTTKKLIGKVLKITRIHVSLGNSKLGKIPNFNLTPMITCTPEACATCGQRCYACNSHRQYPNVRRAWDENTEAALFEVDLLEAVLGIWFKVYKPQFFRIHSGGDFATIAYTEMWYRLIEANPHTRFLAYTKQWIKIRAVPFYRLPNMSLKLSAWPGTEIPEDLTALYPIAYLIDGSIPASALPPMVVCPGSCATCKACYRKSEIVGFAIHGYHLTPEEQHLLDEALAGIKRIEP